MRRMNIIVNTSDDRKLHFLDATFIDDGDRYTIKHEKGVFSIAKSYVIELSATKLETQSQQALEVAEINERV